MQTLQKLQKLAIAEANTENVSAYAYENILGINITGTETEKIACSGNVENYSSGEKYGVVWRRVRGRAVNRKELLALYGLTPEALCDAARRAVAAKKTGKTERNCV